MDPVYLLIRLLLWGSQIGVTMLLAALLARLVWNVN